MAAAARSAARASSSFGLNPFSIAGAGSSLVLSPAARLRFSDSDASSDGGSPAPLAVGDVRGKQSQRARSRSSGHGLRRHAQFPPGAPAASLGDAGRACTGFEAGVVAHAPSLRLASVVVHPPRLIGQVDADDFREIASRRRRRPRLDTGRPVRRGLEGKCFNCLVTNHLKAQCQSLPRCFSCKATGHHVRQRRRSRRRPRPPSAGVAPGSPLRRWGTGVQGTPPCPVFVVAALAPGRRTPSSAMAAPAATGRAFLLALAGGPRSIASSWCGPSDAL